MGKWFSKNFRAIIYVSFLVPIITVAIVSISHVTAWYGISNPLSWAVYLSIGIEIAALSALAAISAQMGSKVYVPFGIVTLIQFVGNIFFAFEYIELTSEQFLSWVELVGPILEYTGIEQGDVQSHRRFLAIFAGGMLPLISLSFLHMLVKFNEENTVKSDKTNRENSDLEDKNSQEEPIQASDLVAEVSRFRPSQEELDRIEDLLKKIPHEEPKKRPTKEEQREILTQMMRESEEMGLYDEPFDNPLIKEIVKSDEELGLYDEKMEITTSDLPDEARGVEPPAWMDEIPEPTEEDYRDWDVTLTDGLEQDVTWDEDHALDQVLNNMVEDLTEEEIKEIIVNDAIEVTPEVTKPLETPVVTPSPRVVNVVLDELPSSNDQFEVDVKVETTPEPTKRVPNKYEEIEEYLNYTRNYDQGSQEEPEVTPAPTVNPNFVFREPIQDQEDPEKKN